MIVSYSESTDLGALPTDMPCSVDCGVDCTCSHSKRSIPIVEGVVGTRVDTGNFL